MAVREIDLYDLSGDCRYPQLLTGASVGLTTAPGNSSPRCAVTKATSHRMDSPTTRANLGAGYIYPIDITNPTKPKLLTQYFTAPGRVHGLNISDDGNRAYVASLANGARHADELAGHAAEQRPA